MGLEQESQSVWAMGLAWVWAWELGSEWGSALPKESGEALAPRLYAFTYRGRDMCVRPEFTASVGRLFVERLQDAPLPQRLYYAGPVLRHEKPQRGQAGGGCFFR